MTAAEETAREREAQHLEPKIRDPRALAQVARMVADPSRPSARHARQPDPEEGTRASSRRTA